MRFFNGLFSSKKTGNNPNLQNWGSAAATPGNNGTSVLLEYPSDDDSSVELSSSSTDDESHQLPYVPSKHGSHRRARCPPFGAKSLMGFRQAQEDAWSHMPEVAWLSVRSTRRQSQPTKLSQSPRRTDQGEGIPQSPDTSNHTSSPPPLRRSTSSKRLSSSGAPTQQPPALVRTLTSKGLLRPILQGGLASKKVPTPFEPVPGMQGHHPVHFFAVFDGHGGSAVAKHCSKRLHKNLKEVFELAWTEAIAESAKARDQHQQHSGQESIERVYPGLQHQLSQSRHQSHPQQQRGMFAAKDSGTPQVPQAAAESVPPQAEQPEHVVPATGGASSPLPLHDCEPCAAPHKNVALTIASPPDCRKGEDAGAPAVLSANKREGAVGAAAVSSEDRKESNAGTAPVLSVNKKEGAVGAAAVLSANKKEGCAEAVGSGALDTKALEGGAMPEAATSTTATDAAQKHCSAAAAPAAAAPAPAPASNSSLSGSSTYGAKGQTANGRTSARVAPDSHESASADSKGACSSKHAEAHAVVCSTGVSGERGATEAKVPAADIATSPSADTATTPTADTATLPAGIATSPAATSVTSPVHTAAPPADFPGSHAGIAASPAHITTNSGSAAIVGGGAYPGSRPVAEGEAANAKVPAADIAASSGSAEIASGITRPGSLPVAEGVGSAERNSAAFAADVAASSGSAEIVGGGACPGSRPVAEGLGSAEMDSAAAAAAGVTSDPPVLPAELPHVPLVEVVPPSSRPTSDAPGLQDNHHPDSAKSTPSTWPAETTLGHTSPAAPTSFKPDVAVCLAQAFVRTNQEVFNAKISRETGSTAVVLLTSEDNIWLANCGDSRAILCRDTETVCLSDDHKASRPDEVARIQAAGGYVWWDRVMGELAVSRAIGDHCFSPYVIPEPEVVCIRRVCADQLIILATDGMWDVFTNEEAHEAAWGRFQKELGKGRSSQEAAKRTATWLVDKSIDRGSRDNVTVVVVDVRMPNKGSRKGARGARGSGEHNQQCQREGSDDLEEDGQETAEGGEVDSHFQGVSASQGQSEQKTQHTVARGAQLGDGQSIGRRSGGKSKGGRKQKDGCEGAGKGSPKKQAAGQLGTAGGGVLEEEQEQNSLSTNSLPRRGFSSAASMNHFSVDEPPNNPGRQQSGSKLKSTSSRLEPAVSEATPPAAPAPRCCGCWGSR